MAKRLTSEATNIEGQNIVVDIYDNEYSGAVNTFVLEQPLYELTYKPSSADKYAPFLFSTCGINMLIQNEAYLISFLSDLQDSQERRFVVIIYIDGFIEWLGYLMTDKIIKQDNYVPYTLSLVATDYIKVLKELPYENTDIYTQITFQDLLFDVVDKIGLVGFHSMFSSFIRVITQYYPQQLTNTATKNPLDHTRIRPGRLIELDNDGNNTEETSWYDVLEQICYTFNARFYYSKGHYRFEEINELDQSSHTVHIYDTSNTKINTATISVPTLNQYTQVVKEDTATEEYLNPLRRVVGLYQYYEGANIILEQGNVVTVGPRVEVGDRSLFYYRVKIQLDSESFRQFNGLEGETLYIKLHISFRIGGFSFRRFQDFNITGGFPNSPGPEGWVSGVDYYTVYVSTASNIASFDFEIPTDVFGQFIPESGNLIIDHSVEGGYYFDTISQAWVFDDFGGPINAIEISVADAFLEILYNGFPSETSTETRYVVRNTNANNSQEIKREYWFGDGPSPNVLGAIEYSDDLVTWASTDLWVNRSRGPLTITQLLINDILAAQSKVLPIKVHNNFDYYSPLFILTNSGDKYMFHRGKFDGYLGSCNGEWILLSRDETTNSPDEPVDIEIFRPNPQRGMLTGVFSSNNYQQLWYELNPLFRDATLITTISTNLVEKTGATAITILPLPAERNLNEGDIIQLINPYNGVNQMATVAVAAGAGETVIQVEPIDLLDTYPSGSYIRTTGINSAGTNTGGGVYTGGSCFLNVETFLNQSSASITTTIALPTTGRDLLLEVYRGGLKGINGTDFTVIGNTITPVDGDYENENIKVIVFGSVKWQRQVFLNHSGTHVELTEFKLITSNKAWLKEQFLNQSGTTVTITVGTLPTTDVPGNLILYRGSRMAIYNTDFTISGNVISFTEDLENEDVYVQFREENLGDLLRVYRGGRFGIYNEDFTINVSTNRITPSSESGDYENENIEVFQRIC